MTDDTRTEPVERVEDLLTPDEQQQLTADLQRIARQRRRGEDAAADMPLASPGIDQEPSDGGDTRTDDLLYEAAIRIDATGNWTGDFELTISDADLVQQLAAEVERLRAELDRARPVVDAAVRWRSAFALGLPPDPSEGQRLCDDLDAAVREYLDQEPGT